MNDEIEQITRGSVGAIFDRLGVLFLRYKQKRRLRMMLRDERFPKGFRSIKQLSAAISCDKEKTAQLLVSMGARKSENSDEWTIGR